MPTVVKAKYTFAGDPATNTPAFTENEHLTLVHRHDNGWLEIDTAAGVRGFVSPAWVDEVVEEAPVAVVVEEAPAAAAVSTDAAAAPVATSNNLSAEPDGVRPLQIVRTRSAIQQKAEEKSAAPLPQVPTANESQTEESTDAPEPVVASPPRKKTLTLDDIPVVAAASKAVTQIAAKQDDPSSPGPDEPPPPPPGTQAQAAEPEPQVVEAAKEPEPAAVAESEAVVEESHLEPAVPRSETRTPVLMVSSASEEKQDESSKGPPPMVRSRSPSGRRSPSPEPGASPSRKAAPAVKPRGSSADVGVRNKIRSLSTSSADEKKLVAPAPKRRPMSSEFTSRLELKLGGLGAPGGDKKPPPVIPTRSDSKRLDDQVAELRSGGSTASLYADGSRKPHRPAPAPPSNVKPARQAPRDRRSTSNTKPRRQTGGSRASEEELKSPTKQEEAPAEPEVSREIMDRETMEGCLDRKLMREGGQNVKKRSWQTYFVTLIGTNLLFHANEKAKKNGKDPVFTMDVSDKEVAPAIETKKKYAFVVGNESDRILLQANDEIGMRTWKEVLKTAKSSLSVGSSSDTAKNRRNTTPKKKRNATDEEAAKLAASGSGKEASSPKPKYSYVRRKLKEYLSARPNKQELVSKGILEDAVFGGTLVQQVEKEKNAYPNKGLPNIPLIVTTCVPKVEADITEQGIYRVSGNSSLIQKLVGKANADPSFSIESSDVHIVTGLLKLYFRELADPVFTEDLYSDWIAAGKMQNKEEKLKKMKDLLDQVPEENKATLKYLFQHLTNVSKYADVNKMQINNLAIVFGPTLLRQSEPSLESIVMDAPYQSSCVEDILRNMDVFFPN